MSTVDWMCILSLDKFFHCKSLSTISNSCLSRLLDLEPHLVTQLAAVISNTLSSTHAYSRPHRPHHLKKTGPQESSSKLRPSPFGSAQAFCCHSAVLEQQPSTVCLLLLLLLLLARLLYTIRCYIPIYPLPAKQATHAGPPNLGENRFAQLPQPNPNPLAGDIFVIACNC